jgi:hypothetical protein
MSIVGHYYDKKIIDRMRDRTKSLIAEIEGDGGLFSRPDSKSSKKQKPAQKPDSSSTQERKQ